MKSQNRWQKKYNMKNHVQLNPIADFKRIDIILLIYYTFDDLLTHIFHFNHLPPAKPLFQPYFPFCLLFYRRVFEVSYNSCTFP